MNKNKPYFDARENFHWDRPANYNFVRDTFSDWASIQPDATALFWVNRDGAVVKRSYAELLEDAGRAAAILKALGIEKGDTVLVIMSRELCWWEVMLGCLQIGAVISPGTVQLKSKDIGYRLKAAGAQAVVTTQDHVTDVDAAAGEIGWSGAKICTDDTAAPGWSRYNELKRNIPVCKTFADTASSDPALCYFTSGTTGFPKLTVHRHDYPLGHKGTGAFWLSAKPGSLVWNLSDTGWAKAAWSSLFAPWLCGAGVFALHADGFGAEETLKCLVDYPVTMLCAPPTVYRIFVQMDIASTPFHSLERCVSAGEPLNPEVIEAWRKQTGFQIFEGYGQTETVLLCGNFEGMEIKPGSMGLPAPGINLQIVDEAGRVLDPDEEGDVAVNVDVTEKPLGMFVGYKDDEERTASVYRGDWYLTGDRATRDEDGYFWFVGRSDDVILSSGYRIGPFEVESVLIEHDAVMESAVVASPDEKRGEVVKAFIVLAKQFEASDDLATEIQDFVKSATAPYKYPRKIEFVKELPKTISGKIRRKELKEKEWASSD